MIQHELPDSACCSLTAASCHLPPLNLSLPPSDGLRVDRSRSCTCIRQYNIQQLLHAVYMLCIDYPGTTGRLNENFDEKVVRIGGTARLPTPTAHGQRMGCPDSNKSGVLWNTRYVWCLDFMFRARGFWYSRPQWRLRSPVRRLASGQVLFSYY
jgi:hypothetical protein